MAKKRAGKNRTRQSTNTAALSGRESKAGVPAALLRDAGMWLVLLSATLIAYLPAINGTLVWDDDHHLTRPDLQSLDGLWRIWFQLGATQQYYPLLHTAFWIEHFFWGDAVLGYHLTNIVLHATAAGLVVLIVRRLSLPGAWLAGFVFALHPVCVEAVAWISEQKSTLSAVFCLAAALAYLHFDQSRRRRLYLAASGLFVLALLAKTVIATLPAALLVVLWWKRGRLGWKRDILPLLPWLIAGAGAGLFTAWVERKFIGAEGAYYALTAAQRFLLAGRVLWFYALKIIWPVNLMFTYPRWVIDPRQWWAYLFPAGILAVAIVLFLLARKHRAPLAALLIFAGTLSPVLGFLNVYPFRYSWVADHFAYLASLAVIVPVACALVVAAQRVPLGASGRTACGIVLLLALGVLTWRQSGMYRDAETLYRRTLARNPESVMAHNNLCFVLSKETDTLPEAIAECEAALRIRADSAEPHENLGNIFSRMPGHLPDAVSHYEAALRFRPHLVEARLNLADALAQMGGRLSDAAAQYQAVLQVRPNDVDARNNFANVLAQIPGRLPEAIIQLEAVLHAQPDNARARNNLGNALAQTPGRLPEAIEQYREAVRIRPDYVQARLNLGRALAQAGRVPEAIAEYQAALRIRPDLEPARQALEELRSPAR